MKALWLKLQNSTRFEKICKIVVYVLIVLYVFSLPTWSARSGWQYISYGIMALFAAFVVLYTLLYSWFTFRWAMLILPLFCLWALVGTIGYSHEFRVWLTLPLMTLTLFIFYYSFNIISNVRFVFSLIIVGLFGFALYFFAVYWRDLLNFRDFSDFRIGSYFDNVNSVGGYCSLGFGLSFYLLLFPKKMSKPKIALYYFCFAITLLSFSIIGISTGSRTFLVDVFLIAILMVVVRLRKRPLIATIAIVAVIGLGILLLSTPFMSNIRDRLLAAISNALGITREASSEQRTIWQLYAMELGAKRMIFGYGSSGFSIVSGVGTYSHGSFAEILCNFGVGGLCLFYFFIIYLVYRLFKIKTNESLCLLSIIAAMFLMNAILSVYYYSKWAYLFMALCSYLTFQSDESARTKRGYVQMREVPDRMI